MPAHKSNMAVMVFFIWTVWALVAVLELIAAAGWSGPVPVSNLERGFDAGALFYTEVDLEDRSMTKKEASTPDPHSAALPERKP